MKNIKELRDVLISNAEKLNRGQMSVAQSSEMSNIAGKIMTSVKLELEYEKQRGKQIEFMEYGDKKVQ